MPGCRKPWNPPERQALWDKHQSQFGSIDHGTPPAGKGESIASVPTLPETDPTLLPVFEKLRAQLRADRYELWIAPLTATIENDQVTFWASSQLLLDEVARRFRAQLKAALADLLSEAPLFQIRLFTAKEPHDAA